MDRLQRTNITDVVAEYKGMKTPTRSDARSIEASLPRPKKKSKTEVPATADPWYVVIDEIVEGTVTFEAWPWPDVNPDTHFLRFDLSKTENLTLDLHELQERINDLRRKSGPAITASRSLRIGDVFQVDASDIKKLNMWWRVIDDTDRKRHESQAALHAMAAPVVDPATAQELERLAQMSQQHSQDGPTPPQNPGSKAFPAV